MAEQKTKVIIDGIDNTGKAFKSASKNVSVFQRDVSGLAKTLGVGLLAAGAGATAFLYSAAKGAAEAQSSLARVDATLKAMGESALKNRDAILAASQAAVQLGFDDEAAAESITNLFQKTNDLTLAQRASQLAMDLSAKGFGDLSATSDVLGKVLAGNVGILGRMGIQIDENASSMQALAILEQMYGNQAEERAKTFEGQMLVLSESFSNLKDTIGLALIEAIQPFIEKLVKWASNPDVQKKVAEIAKLMGEWATVTIPVLVEAVTILWGWFTSVVNVLTSFGEKILWAIDLIGKFVRAVKSISSKALNFVFGGSIGEVPARAMGGPVSMGAPYLVGEKGPEFFVPSQSGTIVPNNKLAGVTVNIYNPMMLDDQYVNKVGDQIIQQLRRDLRY